jgi:hypothetical protein
LTLNEKSQDNKGEVLFGKEKERKSIGNYEKETGQLNNREKLKGHSTFENSLELKP